MKKFRIIKASKLSKASKLAFTILLASCIMLVASVPFASAAENEITVDAKAALLVDADTGYVLLSQNADERLYPASLTKIMTTLLALEIGNLDDEVTVTATALENLSIYGSTAELAVGDKLTVEDLLYCIMVQSANEACNVIAEYISGSVNDFIVLMNERAAELGCKDTHFMNAHGLHDDNHYTSANDLYLIVKEAMKIPEFMEISNTISKKIPAGIQYLTTTNYLLSDQHGVSGYYYSYARGIKTGTTTPAGMCLVSSAEKGEITLISVLLGAQSVTRDDGTVDLKSFSETKRMFEWGFNNFSNETLISKIEPIAEVKVGLSAETDSVVVHADGDITAMVPKGYDEGEIEREIIIYSEQPDGEEVLAPVEKGQVLGEMKVSYMGEELGSVDLVALNSVERSPLQYFFMQLSAFLAMPAVKILIGVIIFIVIAYIAFLTIMYFRKRNRKSALGATYKGSSRRKPK